MSVDHLPVIPEGGRRCTWGQGQSLAAGPCGLLEEEHPTPGELGWRTVAKAYRATIEAAIDAGCDDLLIETADDLGWGHISREAMDDLEARLVGDA